MFVLHEKAFMLVYVGAFESVAGGLSSRKACLDVGWRVSRR